MNRDGPAGKGPGPRPGLISFWRRDLAERLAAGAARTPLHSAGGARWLRRWMWVCVIVGATLYAADGYRAGFLRLNALAADYPSWLWQWLTVLGDERVAFALGLLLALRFPRIFWTLVLAGLVAAAYSRGLKELVDGMRPPGVLPADSFHLIGPEHRRNSFPSGHSVTVGVFFGVLIYFARSTALRLLFLALAVAAGVSRVAVGVHWPLDVAAGLCGGALSAWLGVLWAARWTAPVTDLAVHLAFVTLGAILALGLILDDGGYRAAAAPLTVLGAAALGATAYRYLLRPWLAYRRSPDRRFPRTGRGTSASPSTSGPD